MLQVELAYVAKREHCVPFGLLDKARLRRDVKRDQLGYRAAAFPLSSHLRMLLSS